MMETEDLLIQRVQRLKISNVTRAQKKRTNKLLLLSSPLLPFQWNEKFSIFFELNQVKLIFFLYRYQKEIKLNFQLISSSYCDLLRNIVIEQFQAPTWSRWINRCEMPPRHFMSSSRYFKFEQFDKNDGSRHAELIF